MILTLDVGNSQLFSGLFAQGELIFRFRKTSVGRPSSDELGLFLRHAIRENGHNPADITDIVMSSVVPEINHSLSSACIKYFDRRPLILQAGLKTGLKIKYRNPLEVGADRIANSIGATHLYPGRNLLIVDFGTATTLCVVSAQREYLGGVIAPGLRMAMETLEASTAKLPTVEIKVPEHAVGQSTIAGIQSGIYYSTLGLVREIIIEISDKHFPRQELSVVGTGGFSSLFTHANLFDVIESDLVLKGLYQLHCLNAKDSLK